MNVPTYTSLVARLMEPEAADEVTVLDIPGRYLIGTDPTAAVRIPDHAASSRLHAILILEPAVLRLQDLASVDGTYLNDSKVDSTSLRDGDVIRCGRASIRISLVTAEAAQGESTVLSDAMLAARCPPLVPGYENLSWIASGALGAVYKGHQLGSNRLVAIKCIRPELQAEDRTRSLFLREAAIMARLRHPRIVECLDFGLIGQLPYLVMEYIPCESLEAILWRHKPGRRVRLAVKAVLRILEALAYAHQEGVVHRDVKPSNVLASSKGGRLRLKLSDFGLAKVFNLAGYSGITASNEICGTLAYMSPEQLLDSRSARPDADVYAVLVCLYRLLTREYPYAQGTPIETIQRRLQEDPQPVQRYNPHVPEELSRIINCGLSRDRDQRYDSAAALQAALARLECVRTHSQP